ncbi:MAG: GNAT family N-acetyltransferase, partial [Cellulomonadaceae bacterium]|nr:GNAT family N-acetyltransferase [Cellulomonadaceae bacterium]
EGRQWLWEVDGKPVCWAGHSNPSSGVAGIANVFTPRDHRGHGYASALVAHLTQTLHDQGLRVILYTDLANPVSNGVYQRIGYQPIADTAEVRLTPPPQN